MLRRKIIITTALVIGLSTASPLQAAEVPVHEGHATGELTLSLNAGNKWQGDENMINGMNTIRAAFSPRMHAIHAGSLSAAEYKALASDIQGQVDFMVANCKLTPEADEQFHIVLGQILKGISDMEKSSTPDTGAVRIVSAMNSYGDYFVHPGWQPLE